MEPHVYVFDKVPYYRVAEFSSPPYNLRYKHPSKFMAHSGYDAKAFLRARHSTDDNGGGLWTVSDTTTKKDELFVRKSHCKDFIEELTKGLVPLPKEIKLKKHERFIADDGRYLMIKTVGERDYDKCYFKVRDVGKELKYMSLPGDIANKSTGHVFGIEYVYFVENNVQEVYFTYYGILRLFFACQKKRLLNYLSWICYSICTIQLGKVRDKLKYSTELTNVDPKTVNEIYSEKCYDLPYVYIFCLGKAKDLRDSLGLRKSIPDSHSIYEWGECMSMRKKLSDLVDEYGEYEGVEIRLVAYGIVDPAKMKSAVKSIATFIDDNDNDFHMYNDFTTFKHKHETEVIEKFEEIATDYCGVLASLSADVEKYKKQLVEKDREIDQLKKQLKESQDELKKSQARVVELEEELKSSRKKQKVDDEETDEILRRLLED